MHGKGEAAQARAPIRSLEFYVLESRAKGRRDASVQRSSVKEGRQKSCPPTQYFSLQASAESSHHPGGKLSEEGPPVAGGGDSRPIAFVTARSAALFIPKNAVI